MKFYPFFPRKGKALPGIFCAVQFMFLHELNLILLLLCLLLLLLGKLAAAAAKVRLVKGKLSVKKHILSYNKGPYD